MTEERKPGFTPVDLEKHKEGSLGAKGSPIKRSPIDGRIIDEPLEDEGDPDIVYSFEEEHVLHGNKPSASGAVTSGQKLP